MEKNFRLLMRGVYVWAVLLMPMWVSASSLVTAPTSDTILDSSEVRVIDGVFIIPQGITLTLSQGTVVKIKPTASIVVRGTLKTEVTSDAPVVITSWKDDSVGGDTNGDGSASTPSFAEWKGIEVEGGVVSLTHTKVSYGGNEIYGAFRNRGGSLTFQNVELFYNAVYGVNQDSGSVVITNSLVRNTSIGVNVSGGTVRVENSIFRDLYGRGVMVNAAQSAVLIGNHFERLNIPAYVENNIPFEHRGNTAIENHRNGYERGGTITG